MPLASSAELTSAYLSATVASLAIVASVVTTWLTLRHQRALAVEDRLFAYRAKAYERLLRYQHENSTFEGLLPPPVAAGLNAYGSFQVHDKLAAVRRAGAEPAFGAAIDELVAQIRVEVQSRADVRRLHTSTRWQRG